MTSKKSALGKPAAKVADSGQKASGAKVSLKTPASISVKVTSKRPSKPTVVIRTDKGIVVDGVPGSRLVGKYPSVKVQPAPGKPKRLTDAEISAAVEKHMKLVNA